MTEWQSTIIYMALFVSLIFIDAVGDAMYDNKKKTLSGVFQTILVGVMLFGICFLDAPVILRPIDYTGAIWLAVGYVCRRYALFDFTYNIARDLNMFYSGSTKILDKFWKWWFKFTKFPAPHWFFITRLMALLFGLHAITRGVV